MKTQITPHSLSPSNWDSSPTASLPALRSPSSPSLIVPFGQLTFNAEGQENTSRYFSRQAHWPGGVSGVTIGRGYDLGQRTRQSVVSDLTRAGLDRTDALTLSRGSGLVGLKAQDFLKNNKQTLPTISLEQQQTLFSDVLVPQYVNDVKRILNKPDVIDAYGKITWEDLPTRMQELLFDLRYRGDYSPVVRSQLHPFLAAEDYQGAYQFLADKDFWSKRGVPKDRIERRADFATQALSKIFLDNSF